MLRVSATCALSIASLLWFAGKLRADVDSTEPRVVNWSGSGEGREIKTFANLGNRKPEPGAQVLKRVRVMWDAVGPQPGVIAIRGKLVVVSEDGRSTSPVDWFQGIRVLVARAHTSYPDWTKGHRRDDTARSDCLVRPDGSFSTYLRPGQIRRPIGGRELFQVGVCLATRVGMTVTWDVNLPVHPASIGKLSLAGPKPLGRTLEIINAAPAVQSAGFDPAALIRAVNHLHALGKPKAIAALREFLDVCPQGAASDVERIPADIDTGDAGCVFLVVRLLFEPARVGQKLPDILTGGGWPYPEEEDMELWPIHPLEMRDDIPFMVVNALGNLGGMAEPPWVHVDWAEGCGKLRAAPLRPADNPLAAADALCSIPKTRRLHFSDEIRRQALNITVRNLRGGKIGTSLSELDLLPYLRQSKPRTGRGERAFSEAEWEALRALLAARWIHWNSTRQEYVAGKPDFGPLPEPVRLFPEKKAISHKPGRRSATLGR